MRRREQTTDTETPKENRCGSGKKVVERFFSDPVYGKVLSDDRGCMAVGVVVF